MSRIALVDVYVLRGSGADFEVLMLRRAPGGKRAGTRECVHGKIEPGESAAQAAFRELREETGCEAATLYNLSRVEHFYVQASDEVVLIPVFAAFLADGAQITLSDEHSEFRWLRPDDARPLWTWPRAERSIDDAVRLLGGGDAGLVENVLRIRPP
ncbi:MAG: NUDIX domain-containing protein [Gemmatimonadales bacterium]